MNLYITSENPYDSLGKQFFYPITILDIFHCESRSWIQINLHKFKYGASRHATERLVSKTLKNYLFSLVQHTKLLYGFRKHILYTLLLDYYYCTKDVSIKTLSFQTNFIMKIRLGRQLWRDKSYPVIISSSTQLGHCANKHSTANYKRQIKFLRLFFN